MKLLVVILLFVRLFHSEPQNIHFIVHSHCDPGWLESTEMYFDEKVKQIIDRNIEYLMSHPEAKYNFVEGIYLHMWWENSTPEMQQNLVKLVENGQWEIQMGGWVMNDQATPTYSSSIDQLTHGHNFVKKNLNAIPVEGFSLDTFGVTPTQAYLYSLAGFKYSAAWRIPYNLVDEYENKQQLEFWWSDNHDSIADKIFMHILDEGYYAPGGFQFFADAKDNPPVTPENVEKRAAEFVEFFLQEEIDKYLEGSPLLLMWGGDFAITDPEVVYGNTTNLMNYINEHPVYSQKFKLFYSTASEYFKEAEKKVGSKIRTLDIDFYPYDESYLAYWTGYYVSQPRMKLRARFGERMQKVAESIYVMAYLENSFSRTSYFSIDEFDSYFDRLFYLRSKMGQLLHHDAITGTEKWSVADIYINELDLGTNNADEMMRVLLSYLVSPSWLSTHDTGKMSFLISDVDLKSFIFGVNDSASFFVFNSLGWNRVNEFIELTFFTMEEDGTFELEVVDAEGKVCDSVIVSQDSYGLLKVSVNIRLIVALSFKYFEITMKRKMEFGKKMSNSDIFSISNEIYEIHFNKSGNKISRIINKMSSIDMVISMDFKFYKSFIMPYKYDFQTSGAYVLRPDSGTRHEITWLPSLEITENSLYSEARMQFGEYIDVGLRLYQGGDAKTFELVFYQVGIIPANHEVIMEFNTEIQNNQKIYHDELGFEMKEKNFRKVSEGDDGLNVAANHQPTQYCSYIEDANHRLTFLTTKSQSVASMLNGQFETMIHRTTSTDDGKGLEQPLMDRFVIQEEDYFRMRISLDTPTNGDLVRTKEAYTMNYPLHKFPIHPNFWNRYLPKDFKTSYSLLKEELDEKLNLLTLKKNDKDSDEFVLRLNNMNEDGGESINVNMDDLLEFDIADLKETYLTLLKDKNEVKPNEEIEIRPMEIKTFSLKF